MWGCPSKPLSLPEQCWAKYPRCVQCFLSVLGVSAMIRLILGPTHLIRIENIHSSLGAGARPVPEFCLGVLFPHIQMEYMVVARAVVSDDRECIRFVESYPARNV